MTLGEKLAPHLPFLRRYARALTGAQAAGDAYVRAALQALVAEPAIFPAGADARVGLYTVFHRIWNSAQPDRASPDAGLELVDEIADRRLRPLTPLARQMLLLTTMEGFCAEDAARIADVSVAEVDRLAAEAIGVIDAQTRARVLVIEDEPIIAMDIESIVEAQGHDVVAIAATRDAAVADARRHQPNLILADIQLADDSSGIDAVADIQADNDVPVIFITAFPERLLTGEGHEPTFLVTKPFKESTLKATISQALFFNAATVPA